MDAALAPLVVPALLKLDLGCGTRKQEGFVGVDCRDFDGVDWIINIGRDRWPFDDASAGEAYCSHVLEHLTQPERCHFFNELYRVMAPGARITIITPHWASNRAYGDPTHVWPPVSEMAFYYLDASWRATQAPHVCDLLTCDFRNPIWNYSGHPSLNGRSAEYQQYALTNFKDAALDLITTLVR